MPKKKTKTKTAEADNRPETTFTVHKPESGTITSTHPTREAAESQAKSATRQRRRHNPKATEWPVGEYRLVKKK